MIKTSLITPCNNKLPEVIDHKAMQELYNHLTQEFGEVCIAMSEWRKAKDGKTMAHLGEELADLATMSTTMLQALEKMGNSANFANNVLLMVASKNYTRGYTNTPMI
jgi:hypothetical protein